MGYLKILQKNGIIALILLLALIHGLLYVFIVPVWEHYDEPGNFEVAWLMAHRPGIPKWGDYDPGMRRAVLSSIINSRFFEQRGFAMERPGLNDIPAWIGVSQIGDPPLYFWLASLPMRILPPMAINRQLYAGRLVSLAMYLATILAAWGIMEELLPPGHALCWMVPAMLALLPGFTDIMTSVNSDVGAVLFYTLWLWVTLRLLRRGLSLLRLAAFIGLFAACILTKKTVYLVLITAPIALVLILFKGRWQILVWSILGLAGAVVLAQMLSWDDPAGWYRTTDQAQPGRVTVLAPVAGGPAVGGFALQVALNPGTPGFRPAFSQTIPIETMEKLLGKTVTVAGWMWASSPVQTTTPALNVFDSWPSSQNRVITEPVTLGTTPQFFAVHYQIPDKARLIVLAAAPISDKKQKGQGSVYYSHLILVDGAYPADQIPKFTDSRSEAGAWGGRPFNNLVRNASAVDIWPRWNGPLYSLINSKLGAGTNAYGLIAYSLDLPRYQGYALLTAENLFRTFWAKFSWGQVALIGLKPYWLFLLATLVCGIGLVEILVRRWRQIPWKILIFLLLVAGLSWVYDLLIGIIIRPLIEPNFITAARYAYPAIVPTALVLNAGWWGTGILVKRLIPKSLHLPRWTGQIVYFVLFFCLDAYGLISIIQFYR